MADIKLPTDRKFGLFFGAVSFLTSIFFLLSGRTVLSGIFLLSASAFVVFALVRPRLLRPLNRLWMALGLALGRVFNPLVMGLIFYLIIVPTGLFMRLIGRDELRMRGNDRHTYWRQRVNLASSSEALDIFKRQF